MLWIDGLDIDGTFVISAPTSLRRPYGQNQAIKKPGLNKGSPGSTLSPACLASCLTWLQAGRLK
jgi:hypothetical protein